MMLEPYSPQNTTQPPPPPPSPSLSPYNSVSSLSSLMMMDTPKMNEQDATMVDRDYYYERIPSLKSQASSQDSIINIVDLEDITTTTTTTNNHHHRHHHPPPPPPPHALDHPPHNINPEEDFYQSIAEKNVVDQIHQKRSFNSGTPVMEPTVAIHHHHHHHHYHPTTLSLHFPP